MPALLPIDDRITAIDHDLLGIPNLGVTYVVRGDPDQVALIETGTSLTVPATLAGLEQLDIPREAIRHVLCTHIHMDHSGGAGLLADALPNASVYINSASAEHLIDPTKLLGSTRRAVGELLWPLQGTIRPLPAARLRPAETLRLDLGRGIVLHAIATPGHSADHIAFREERSGALFAGDACGIMLPHYGVGPYPVNPPPGFDLDQQIATYERLRTLPITRLLVTHCGAFDAAAATIREQHLKLLEVADAVHVAIEREQLDPVALAARLLPAGDNDLLRAWSEMTIAGVAHYFRKHLERESGRSRHVHE
jgi:glyoxylase-like metal-dependent hydrolase (beta-lactamase superfamily II)